MQKKWALYKHLKETYTRENLVERIGRGVQTMVDQGASYCRTLIDADSTIRTLGVEAALEVKKKFKGQIVFEIGVQPLQGVLDDDSREQFEKACSMADVVGGLPSKDRPTPEKHLDIIMRIAREQNKRLDVHVDQENNPFENETEMLARKTIEHGLEGRVSAIHAISVSAKPAIEQDRIIRLLKDAGVSVIVCPSAALSMKQLDMTAPLHNSIAPVPKLLEAGRAGLPRGGQRLRPVHAAGGRRPVVRVPAADGGVPVLRHRPGGQDRRRPERVRAAGPLTPRAAAGA